MNFIISVSGEGDELNYLDEIEGESFAGIKHELQVMANKNGETLYVREEGTDRTEEVEPAARHEKTIR